MPITKSSRANQHSREVMTAEMYRSLPPGAELARGRRTPLASPDQGDARSPSRHYPMV